MLPSPRTYGQPSTSTQQSSQPTTILDDRFVRVGTLEEESEDKAILNWIYKDEEASTSENISIKIDQCGKGKTILEKMGYEGQGTIGKIKEGIVEPIQPLTL